ncbi:kinase-like protein [Nemania abortiva]|nr:kinase-like protein [Nemania abortiva]
MAPDRFGTRSLRRQLQNSRVRSESGEYFLPDASIISIITQPAINEAVIELQCKADERIGLAERIYRDGKKVFAILLLMSEEDYIVKFRDHGFLDDSLPLSEQDASTVANDIGIHFANQQWELLSESFRPNMWENHQEFGMKKILPFIGQAEDVGEGHFGKVVKVNIVPSQQAFYPQMSSGVQVIRKRLKSNKITKELNNEKMFLRLLNQLQHPNIIRLLGSYTHREEHYFLFPCVDMDLKHFFQKHERFGMFRWDFTFYSALRGLSNALSNAHSLRLNQEAHGIDFEAIGYHHDIRPPNILVSKETFLLADFGLGNLKPTDAQSQTPLKSEMGDWIAPECIDNNQVTRAIDVWAFGCLTAEVASYMQKGAPGVEQFSQKRLLPGRWPGWFECVFYGKDGDIKPEARQWLEDLGHEDSEDGLISSLVTLSLTALTKEVQLRPKISHICDALTQLSFRAHSLAVQQEFRNCLGPGFAPEAHEGRPSNNIWFLQERFCAWDHSLALGIPTDLLDTLNHIHNRATSIMAELVSKLEARSSGNEDSHGSLFIRDDDARFAFESRIGRLIESLWDLLPKSTQRHAQDYWHQAILCTDKLGTLDDVRRVLKLRYPVYNIADAMAKMRKIRLGMLHPNSFENASEACNISLSDVSFTSNYGGYNLGRYQDSVPILVERMWHTPGWDNVHPEQRKLVVGLKAKSLSVDPKPSGLKIMKCIGAFEEKGDRAGYGFVYQYPEGKELQPTSLLECLLRGYRDSEHLPLLGNKFQLAFALADFFKEFHTIGWLHESFNPHNVLFFSPSNDNNTRKLVIDDELRRPYVVGLHKSRPDGSFWQTDGPGLSDDESLQDYQHPDYGSTGRYRQVFDYYSLGVVLLEIGLWRPLSSWKSKFRALSLVEIRQELVNICRGRLGVKMGAAYRNAVLRCLDGSLDDRHGSSDRAVLEWFTTAVVQPLENLARASI